MRIKWDGKTLNVEPQTKSRKHFVTRWNDYWIDVERDEWWGKTIYNAWCYDPNGTLIVNGASYKTMHAAVQDCFDNIGFPLDKIGDETDSE